MFDRPYVLLSVATSIDGYIDDGTDSRLLLSGDDDLDRVDAVRASVDAILVGAETIRRDDPRLSVRAAERRKARVEAGLPESPAKVTLTDSGDLDPGVNFFTVGDGPKLVYCPDRRVAGLRDRLGEWGEVIGVGAGPIDVGRMLDDLGARGIRRLMVEGGGVVHTLFLTGDLVDELHLVIAPFLIGDPAAPRFTHPGVYPQGPGHPLRLVEVRPIGAAALLRYLRE